MSKRQAQRDSTKVKLLETAIELFAKNGFATVRTIDVAKAAGVAHGSVFVHYPTREALIIEAVEAFGRKMASRLHELNTADDHTTSEGNSQQPMRRILHVLQAHVQGIGENEDFYARLAAESPSLPTGARDVLLSIQSAISHHISEALEREELSDMLRQVPSHFIFNAWVGLVNHYLINRDLFAPQGSVIARHGEDIVNHFMTLLGIRKINTLKRGVLKGD